MRMKKAVFAALVSLAIIAALIAVAGRATHAQGSADASVLAKLNEVIGNQQTILADLAGMKEQLRIITIRVTQSQ
jgi:hypothetical protein